MARDRIPLTYFCDAMHQANRVTRDYRLLAHTHERLELIKKGLPIAGKTVIDIGCHVGYIPLHMLLWGADNATGVDIDKDILKCAEKVIRKLGTYRGMIGFTPGNIFSCTTPYDYVLCLGVLHKLAEDDYRAALRHLASITKERLFLEMMVVTGDKPTLRTRNEKGKWPTSTIPNEAWLEDECRNAGLVVHNRQANPVYSNRAIWELRPVKK